MIKRFMSCGLSLLLLVGSATAADHGDAPLASLERSADIADLFMFLDPNDNTQLVLIFTVGGFIVPGENFNFGFFDPRIRYSFLIENTGDPNPDRFIDIRFSNRDNTGAQTATVKMPDGRTFTAPVTLSSATAAVAPAPIITTDATTGVKFYAGEADDPFFFDIPGFLRFTASVRAGQPDATVLQRGRDSFAGYNAMAIALSMPASQLKGTNGNKIGMSVTTQRRATNTLRGTEYVETGPYVNIDRMGNPGVNVALIPFPRKNAYNAGSTSRDAKSEFVPEIVGTLTALGTNMTNIGILGSVAVFNGDMLRIDTALTNSGPGGGDNPGSGFPNGRRLRDDTVDTLLFFIANQNRLGDGADASDVPLRNVFPFVAAPHQPRPAGTVDDNTRN